MYRPALPVDLACPVFSALACAPHLPPYQQERALHEIEDAGGDGGMGPAEEREGNRLP